MAVLAVSVGLDPATVGRVADRITNPLLNLLHRRAGLRRGVLDAVLARLPAEVADPAAQALRIPGLSAAHDLTWTTVLVVAQPA